MEHYSLTELKAKRDAIQKIAEKGFSIYYNKGYMGFSITQSCQNKNGKEYISYVASRRKNGKLYQVRVTDIFDIEERILLYIEKHPDLAI